MSGYGSPVAPVKPSASLSGQTPPQQQAQSYSPGQPPPSHLSQPYGGFSSPQAQDLSSGGATGGGGKGYGSLGAGGRSFSAEVVYGGDSGYGQLPPSLGGAGSPSLGGYDSSPSPSGNSGIIRPGLHSPAPVRPTQSPGGGGGNKYLSSVLSPAFLSSPQGYPETRGPPQPYHTGPPKAKPDPDMLGVERSQEDEDDDDDFLIQHLLQAQSPAPHPSQHHPPPQPPQALAQAQDGNKGMGYETGKSSEERYHLQSVIRTNNATSSAGGVPAGGGAEGLDDELEMSMKKQQAKNERSGAVGAGSGGSGGGRGGADQAHPHPHHQHDSLGSVVHYNRTDPYSQHSLPPHHPSHHQHPHPHPHPHSHLELKKAQDPQELPYLRKTPPELQQQRASQANLSLVDSPPDQPQMLQSVLSHTTRNKMEPQGRQQHSLSQQAMLGGGGGAGAGGAAGASAGENPSQSSQLQLQLQSQGLEAHYGRGPQRDQNQAGQVSPLGHAGAFPLADLRQGGRGRCGERRRRRRQRCRRQAQAAAQASATPSPTSPCSSHRFRAT
ncbi:hypothetical protein SKAU_G00287050 [Synaphobranchus kaupii]|uniref:Uncharacterized protein n=1 Tax=Synaphobranchus kaupii TaxID=118154 RepID=A0A9Q1INK5_SYNKA|nr:hypothetical protein SKAU_G00287050 [Synaphobranchus kaupii]